MTPAGLAVLALIVTNAGTLIAAMVSLYRANSQRDLDRASREQIESDLNKRLANRRIELEKYADDVARYHRKLRMYLLALVDAGVIDSSRIDISEFPKPPEMPHINGGG